MRSGPRTLAFAAAAILVALPALPVHAGGVPPAGGVQPAGGVAGRVVSAATGRPVSGATITIPADGLVTTSRSDGSFSFGRRVRAERPYRPLEAVVTAHGFGRWTIVGAPLSPGDTLRLDVALTEGPFFHRVRGPTAARRAQTASEASPLTSNSCTGWDYQLVPPPTIWVFRHATGVSEQYDFVFYVTHVLPSEWIPSWDADALGAGAVAARTYAAYRAMSGHAYSGGANCADVRDDSQDQVFDPTYSTAATDQAVHATFGSILYRSGGLFLSQYFGGSPGDPCAPVTGQYAGRMDQWGTQTCATQGVLWPAITTTFYAGTTWNYLQNLVLNPSFSSPGMYAWQGDAAATFSRVSGTGYDGGWYLTMSSSQSGTPATVFQQRAFVGTGSTTYHSQVALRCPATSKRNCSVTLEVVAVPASGNEVARTIQVTVKRDGLWYLVGFDPPASGIAHDQVRFAVVSKKPIDVDAALLTSSFGG